MAKLRGNKKTQKKLKWNPITFVIKSPRVQRVSEEPVRNVVGVRVELSIVPSKRSNAPSSLATCRKHRYIPSERASFGLNHPTTLMYTTSIEGLWFAFFSIPGAIFGTHNGTIEISWVTVKNCPLSLEATTGKAEARQLEKAAGKIHPPPFAAKTVTRDCELRPLQFFPGKTRNSKVKNWISSDITRFPTCNYTPTPTTSTIDFFNWEWWRFFWSRTPKQPWRLGTESSDVWIPAAIQGQPLVAAMTSGLQGSNDHLESHPSWEICSRICTKKWLSHSFAWCFPDIFPSRSPTFDRTV